VIRYALVCSRGHDFEAWFASSAAYGEQQAAGHLTCPACGSAEVDKALMAPSLAGGRKKEEKTEAVRLAAHTGRRKEIMEALRKLRKHVTDNADYVGPRFPEEARKIHYGETESRGIYGEAAPEEAREMVDEGIEFHPLPVLPEDKN
jgi:hypothetical protein